MKRALFAFAILGILAAGPMAAAHDAASKSDQKSDKKSDKTESKKPGWNADTFSGLELRGIGPALTSGRVVDLAVDPRQKNVWYVAAASGGVWKTVNSGTTWSPVFDGQSSYSIGCLAVDPRNPLIVWVGTGENNSQRSVSYGDGVYRSLDGGKSWENVGLKTSEHIGRIVIDPRDSKTVYLAAQGPLWSAGGERGLYKTSDGGRSWKQVLAISENTGVTDVVLDPRNPDVLYAAAYQRRRHVWTLIDGGPESALYKSTDAGASWKKLTAGLPKEEMGRIGLAISTVNPDVVFAIVEAANGAGGFFRSQDGGGNWERRNERVTSSPQYYQRIFADPVNVDRVYSMDVWMTVSDDGGKNFHRLGEPDKHSDNHVLWVDPDNTSHFLNGCDGGVYESWDRGATWGFKANLPITQFYNVAIDYAQPFYNVFGGTQDNFSLGGPSRTTSVNGGTNADWFVTQGGDGFQTQVDPEDSNIVYAEAQYGNLVRFDRKNGEQIAIQPLPGKGEPPLRYNWDSPLLISPHSHTRLYFAANRLFRSDDRGNHWRPMSPDLTRQLDRNKIKVMGQIWSIDAVAKNASTSFYGNIVALSESPKKEGLIYVGTDDGLIQVTEDGGASWRKIERFPGIPEMTYVSRVEASPQDADTVYAAFDNHKMGDFKPYLLKSADRGRTWTSIAGDLPERGTVYAVIEDPARPGLLFAGTEFGLFFAADGGRKWVQLKGGMPPIPVFDMVIQKRENDLVLASFGRGFFILDDVTPLRQVTTQTLEQEAKLFPVKPALLYNPSQPLGGRGEGFQGASFYVAPNPPFGAVFTYFLRDELKSLKKLRQEAEKKLAKEGEAVTYPSWDALRAEEQEPAPQILLTVTDEDGHVVRRLTGPVTSGFHRVAWDLRYPPSNPVELKATEVGPFDSPETGPMVAPGTYKVSLAKRVGGKVTPLGEPQTVVAAPLGIGSLPAEDRAALVAFERDTARLQRVVMGAVRAAAEAKTRLDHIDKALLDTPAADPRLAEEARSLRVRLTDLQAALVGDSVIASHNEPTPPSIVERVQGVVEGHWSSSAAATQVQLDAYASARDEFAPALAKLHTLIDVDLKKLEDQMEAAGAPWTPGRVPTLPPPAPK
ncbi:MAG TPA: glycosyl hydrolase [Thermoanaerobaculia bacterium]|nr:glycosyl hydrolase [Thermoanaerobaculia bacterium]